MRFELLCLIVLSLTVAAHGQYSLALQELGFQWHSRYLCRAIPGDGEPRSARPAGDKDDSPLEGAESHAFSPIVAGERDAQRGKGPSARRTNG